MYAALWLCWVSYIPVKWCAKSLLETVNSLTSGKFIYSYCCSIWSILWEKWTMGILGTGVCDHRKVYNNLCDITLSKIMLPLIFLKHSLHYFLRNGNQQWKAKFSPFQKIRFRKREGISRIFPWRNFLRNILEIKNFLRLDW